MSEPEANGRTRGLDERRGRYRRGHVSEWAAAVALMAKGYRPVARRWRCPAGEIDLIAVRGRRLAFVEVKLRGGIGDADAFAAVGGAQRARVRRASEFWLQRHARYRMHEIGYDLILVAPWRWPRHLENGL